MKKIRPSKALSPEVRDERAEARFWAKVSIPADVLTGCWVWAGRKDAWGYGVVQRTVRKTRRLAQAHRKAWEIFHPGEPIGQGLILHSCDNPPCVNPAHLRLGDHRDNMADMKARGRGRAGSAKLRPADVAEIRRRGALGEASPAIAAAMGIPTQMARRVVAGLTWKWVKPAAEHCKQVMP